MNSSENRSLSHVDSQGTPKMVDVGSKALTERKAIAEGRIRLPISLYDDFSKGEDTLKKGPVLHTAIIAGTQGLKRCFELIPFCHPLPIDAIRFSHEYKDGSLIVKCEVKANYKTGVEMEALTGVSIALLTVYDMCKSAGHDMVIEKIRVLGKEGGKSDFGYS